MKSFMVWKINLKSSISGAESRKYSILRKKKKNNGVFEMHWVDKHGIEAKFPDRPFLS